jgi:hypothetical protein
MEVICSQYRIIILSQGSTKAGKRSAKTLHGESRVAAGKFANGHNKLDATACTGHISQGSAIVAMDR